MLTMLWLGRENYYASRNNWEMKNETQSIIVCCSFLAGLDIPATHTEHLSKSAQLGKSSQIKKRFYHSLPSTSHE